jgi:16S rRNA (guanine527-N7)-methyltransferase
VSWQSRVAALAQQHALDAAQADQLRKLLALLATDPHAPSSVTAPGEAVDVHLADSLSALAMPSVTAARRIADIGSGAGFPGLPLAASLPDAQVTLLESSARKCEYLERAILTAGIANARALALRVESWSEGAGLHDLVTARAVASLAVLCEFAAPLLALGGTLVAWKGALGSAEAEAARRAAHELGLADAGAVRVEPYPGSAEHQLVMYTKLSTTPTRFPRRPGVARKRPLGAVK